mmetsp:Transcript_6602/g.11652  ORF Transcript_6602/g.11652 Transcript_6602/m.11652 type:complete len:98 (-) Transcript_6602:129-422(-)
MEREYTELNRKYGEMVAAGKAGKGIGSTDLMEVIQQLQQKGYQLHLMRKGLLPAAFKAPPTTSPEGQRRKEAALRILEEFRGQVPGGGSSAAGSTTS